MTEPLPFLFPDQFVSRHNSAWRVEPGQREPFGPVLAPRYPWDSGAVFSHGTALFDSIDRRFKLWNISNPANSHDRRLTYAESTDGVHWERPELDICAWGSEYPATNILLDYPSGGACSYASVFVDAAAEPDRRYEMFVFRVPRGQHPLVAGLPLPDGQTQHRYGIYRYRSPDGLRWTAVEGPVIAGGAYPHGTSDTCYVYREPDGGYVAYHKTEVASFPGAVVPYDIGRGGCRVAARKTSPDGTHWSDSVIVMLPDWRDAHDTQIMEVLPLRAPGGYVAIVALYHALTQTMDLQIAASRDGVNWWRPDRRPCIANDPLGDFCGGMMFPTRTLIEHDGAYILYFAGLDGIHGDVFDTEPNEQYRAAGLPARPEEFLQQPDNTRLAEVFLRGQWYRDWELHGERISTRPSSIPFHGGTHRAHWRAGRLWAAVPAYGGPSEAVLTTHAQEWAGRRLLLNATTLGDGAVAAELLDGDGRTLEGFSREECHAFRGDESRAPLRWKGGDAPPTTRAFIRFVLRRARLYGFGFE